MKRLEKITAYDESVEQFINECEDPKINDLKMHEICRDFQCSMSIEEIKEKYNL